MKKVNPSQPMIHPVAGLPELFSKCKATKVAVVTDTLYYHYNCCNEYDITWGCAYRCLQTLRLEDMRKRVHDGISNIHEEH